MSSIARVAPLMAAVTILQFSLGLLAVQLPLDMHADGLSSAALGLVGASYSLGFMAGAFAGPTLLVRVGHIRVFSAAAACCTTLILLTFAAGEVLSWSIVRALTGAAIAVLFVAADSWMGAAAANTERGGLIGIYQVATRVALIAGPFLALGAPAQASGPLMVAAGLAALSILPVCLTSQPQPPAPMAKPLALREQYETAPAAVSAAFVAGFVNGGVLLLAPVFALTRFGEDEARMFQAAAWVGSLLLQWPASRLSDSVDRRLVIAGLVTLAAACALLLALFGAVAPFPLAALLFALWGAGGLSFYGVAIAHMADRADPEHMAQAASGILFVWAAGAVAGPVAMGLAASLIGPTGAFWTAAIASLALVGFMVQRRGAREKVEVTVTGMAPDVASVAAAELAFGTAEEAGAETREPK